MQVQAISQHPQDAFVTLQDVHFSYDGKTEVIKGVSLEIQPGQTVVFAGPSILLRKTVLSLKSPTGAFIAPLRCANANF